MNIHKLSAQNADLLLDLQFYTLYKLRVVVQPRGKFLKIFTDVSVVSLHETINMCAKMKTKEKCQKQMKTFSICGMVNRWNVGSVSSKRLGAK